MKYLIMIAALLFAGGAAPIEWWLLSWGKNPICMSAQRMASLGNPYMTSPELFVLMYQAAHIPYEVTKIAGGLSIAKVHPFKPPYPGAYNPPIFFFVDQYSCEAYSKTHTDPIP